MKEIPLTRGYVALVDDEDYAWLSQFKWCSDGHGYAVRRTYTPDGKPTTEKMHRIITKARDGELVDHINGMTWDNRRSNLRIVDNASNSKNRNGPYSNNKSGYKGVAVYKDGKWTAQITVDYKKKHLGVFDDAEDAAWAYNEAAVMYFGQYANLNDIPPVDGIFARHAALLVD